MRKLKKLHRQADDSTSFHFLSAPVEHDHQQGNTYSASSSSSYLTVGPPSVKNVHHQLMAVGDLCHEVPALLGLTDAQQHQLDLNQRTVSPPLTRHHHARSSSASESTARTNGNNGFYKRLMEWLSRKKNAHRRYSETWTSEVKEAPSVQYQETVQRLMAARKSAPMIFDSYQVSASNNNQKKLLSLSAIGGSVSCGSSTTSPTGSVRSDASASSWASRLRGRSSHRTSPNVEQHPIVRIDFGVSPSVIQERDSIDSESGIENNENNDQKQIQHPFHYLLDVPAAERQTLEAPPTTPTSSYSVQSGILQFEKQDSTEETRGEIDAEWIIPWSDIEVGQVISRKGTCTINRGKWHGDVIIHRFELQNANEVTAFWNDVHSLSKLRHENLLLFMGVATDSPTYTIINSAPRGYVSVANYRAIIKNGKQERIGMRAAVSISRQVAQATGYLHARGIVHGKLNPHNIFLEGDNYRVKVSLLDHGLIDTANLQLNYGCLPKTQVGYYSPELVRSMLVTPPEVFCSIPSTKFSDVYALGSFMYDLVAGQPPFHQEEIDSVLWRIGNGQTTTLTDLKCNSRLKALMASCWAYDASQRPSCVEVVRNLSPAALLCKSHSCSEPERLNRLGSCKLAC